MVVFLDASWEGQLIGESERSTAFRVSYMSHTCRGSGRGNRTPGVQLAFVVLLSLAYVTIITLIVTVVTLEGVKASKLMKQLID